MTNDLKITCPKCKETFDAADAFNAHYKNTQIENDKRIKEVKKIATEDAEKKYKSQVENQKHEIEKAKIDAVKNAEEEASKKYKTQLANNQKEIEKAKIDAVKNAEEEASKKYKTQLANNQKEIEKAKKDAFLTAKQESDQKYKLQLENAEKEKKALEQKNKQDLEKQLKSLREQESLKAKEAAEKENRKIIEDLKEQKEKNTKAEQINARRITELNQRIQDLTNQRNVELQGEVQEERIQDFLRKAFPDDHVDEIKKGAKGGDCILTINDREKKNIAKIYFESKDTKAFQEKWVDKLLNDMKDKGIANGIMIVSKSALPPDFNELGGYVERYGNTITIIPMVLPIIHAIVSKIRSILISKSGENNNHQVPLLMKKAWENLQSPNFILPVKSMLAQVNAMEILFKKENESIQRFSANKERNIKAIYDNIVTMINSFYINVGDIFPQDLLSNDSDLLDDDLTPKKIEKKSEVNYQNTEEVKITHSDFSDEFMNLLKTNIHKEWSLSIRTFSALKDLDIIYIGDLITYTETDLLRARNFGQKSLDEIKDCMNQCSLNFGTVLKDWEIIRSELNEDK